MYFFDCMKHIEQKNGKYLVSSNLIGWLFFFFFTSQYYCDILNFK